MNKFKSMIQTFLSDARGSILLTGAGILFSLAVVTTGGVEVANYINTKNAIENAADSALIACAQVSHAQDCETVARNFFNANIPPEYADSINIDSINVTSDPVNLTWRASISASINTKFGGLLGIESIALNHEVEVTSDTAQRVEAVFLLDTSASMCTRTERIRKEDGSFVLKYHADPECEKLESVKQAMNYVIDEGLSPVGQGFVGIVPFNHKVKLPNLDAAPEALIGSEKNVAGGDPTYFTNFTDAEPLSPVIPLKAIDSEADKTELKNLVNSIVQFPEGRGWTRSNIATLTAALMLDPDNYSAFGGVRPNDFNPKLTKKVVIMMTDGANIGCCYAAHPEGNFDNQYLYLYEVDNAHLVGLENMPHLREHKEQYNIPEEGLCKQMKERGMVVYSIVFDVNDNDPGGREIKNVYSQCATSDDYYFDIQDEGDLIHAYKSVAQSLFPLRITK